MRFLTIAAGRRAKYVVLARSLAVLAALAPLGGKFEEAQNNEPASVLPGGAESLAVHELAARFPSGDVEEAVTVFLRDDGLTAADRRAIAAFAADLRRDPPPGARDPRAPVFAHDGTAALVVTTIGDRRGDEFIFDAVDELRGRAPAAAPPGLDVAVTGPAAFTTDLVDVFDGLDQELLLATSALALVLLILIYRSPIFWLIPFFCVLLAEVASRGMGYLLAEAGMTIGGQAGGILPVLVFGAGTDYALLLVARYREELRGQRDKHVAMARALRRGGPAIVASAGTVVAALCVLGLAEVTSTAALGPLGAAGVALAALVTLTILPALLLLAGRRAFWPFVPAFGSAGAGERRDGWRRLSDAVARGPRRVWVGAAAVLAVCIAGLSQLDTGLTSADSYRGDVESVRGQALLDRAFAPGANAPTTVIVRDPARAGAVRSTLAALPGVAAVGRPEAGPPGAMLAVTLDADPYGDAGFALIPRLRSAVGDGVLVGGPTAREHDLRQAAARDNRLIVRVALVVVLLVLALLLRAVVAPLLLVGTVIASFAAALGIGAFFFEHVFGFEGMDPTLPVLAFVFLVALGVDYNIFLMARAREETARHGSREGIRRAHAVTGGVITSAGLVLAGTFNVLTSVPLVFVTELGFVIAVGVLLDTFLVRSLLVPALVLDIGDGAWWPRLPRLAPEGT